MYAYYAETKLTVGREEHEDLLLHEVLLCIRGLCTTQSGSDELRDVAPSLLPALIKMVFDQERKGPSEFKTREIIFNLICRYNRLACVTTLTATVMHLKSASQDKKQDRVKEILGYLCDPLPTEEDAPPDFVLDMQTPRPYRIWHKEISNVTKEVFWIFMHHRNEIVVEEVSGDMDEDTFSERHFPHDRPPVPAAAWVGSVEWEATNYIAAHLNLVNGLIASLTERADRNTLRTHLRESGFERLMGGTLRLSKEKFYGVVHDALRTWVTAAAEDGRDTSLVRKGPFCSEQFASNPSCVGVAYLPELDLPSANFGGSRAVTNEGEWI